MSWTVLWLARLALWYCIDSRLSRSRGPISCHQAIDNSAADSFISRFGYDPGTSCCPGSVRHLHAKISDFPKHLSHSWSLESTGWWFESHFNNVGWPGPCGIREFDHLACLLPKTVESRLGIVKKNCGSPVTVELNWLVFGELVVRLVDFRWIFWYFGNSSTSRIRISYRLRHPRIV